MKVTARVSPLSRARAGSSGTISCDRERLPITGRIYEFHIGTRPLPRGNLVQLLHIPVRSDAR
jgi:hypothetical protein